MLSENQVVNAARAAIEKSFVGVCDVFEYGNILDKKSKVTRQGEVKAFSDVACRLSFEKLSAASQTGNAAGVALGMKLFTPSDINIKEGSKVTVKQNGTIYECKASGVPANYGTHCEVMLEIWKEWA